MPLLLLLTGGMVAHGAPQPAILNVRDFGAVGDGKSDDTRAIQAAILQAEARRATVSKIGSYKKMGTSFKGGPHPEVVFPEGEYLVSETLVCEVNSVLRGEGKARIRQRHPEKDILYFHDMIRAQVEGLSFEGGATQLRFWTNNRGGANISVSRCEFLNAHRNAVECLSLAEYFPKPGEGWAKAKVWSPYLLERAVDGWPTLLRNDKEGLTEWFNSTRLVIEDCRFENCRRVADLQCDNAIITHCEVVTHPDAEGPVFRLAGKAHLSHLKGVAKVNPEKHQYWVEGGGILSFRHLVLDAQGPHGLCLYRSQKRKNISVSVGHSTVVVDQCQLKSAGSREGAFVWLARDAQPSIVSITGNRELSGEKVQALVWERAPSLASLGRMADASLAKAPVERQFMLCVAGNAAPVEETLPDAVAPLRQPYVPQEALRETEVAPLAWRSGELEASFTQVLRATDHGVRIAPEEDQTAALQSVLDLAGSKGDCVVLLPGTAFLLSETLRLPPKVAIKGSGLTVLVQADEGKDHFHAPDARRVLLNGLLLAGGRRGLSAQTPAGEASRVAVSNSAFYDNKGAAVHVWAEGEGANRTEVLLDNSSIKKSYQGVVTNASRAEVRNSGASNHPSLDHKAFFENHGGQMRIEATLTNPYVWQGAVARKKSPHIPKDWALSNQLRWVDNWGRLLVEDVRFGGEDEGICNIYNRSKEGVLRIDGGFTRFFNDAGKKVVLFLEEPSRAVVLTRISGLPWAHKEGALLEEAKPGASRIYQSCVMPPQN